MSDPFWKDDITIILNKHRLVEFVPTKDMTTNEKLNALTRLSIYLGILLSIVYKKSSPIYIPLIMAALMYLVHEHLVSDDQIGGDQPVTGADFEQPTQDNPFMNVLMTDYADKPHRQPAADVQLQQTKDQMDNHFSNGLYKDINNIWDKNNSQRQYYTNPSTTIPNDRDSFMKWCYNTPYTCKDGNLARCLRYEDVRGHGQV